MSSELGTTEVGSLVGTGDKTVLGFPLGGTGVPTEDSSKRDHTLHACIVKENMSNISTDPSDAVTPYKSMYNAGVLPLHYHINMGWHIGTKGH